MSTEIRFTNLKKQQQFFERHEKLSTHMVFEVKLAVKLHAKDLEVGTSSDRNPRQDQVTTGRAHSPGSTNDKSLSFVIGFSVMHR